MSKKCVYKSSVACAYELPVIVYIIAVAHWAQLTL